MPPTNLNFLTRTSPPVYVVTRHVGLARVTFPPSLDGHAALVDGRHATGGNGCGGSRLVPPPLLDQLRARRVGVLHGEGFVIHSHFIQCICHLLLHLRPLLVLVL